MKKFLRLLCISSFAAIPFFAMDKQPKPTEVPRPLEELNDEITNDEVIDLEEPKEEYALDEIAVLEDDATEKISLKDDGDDDEKEDGEVNEEVIG